MAMKVAALKGRPENGKLASAKVMLGAGCILRSQVSALRFQARVIRCSSGCGAKIPVLNLYPNLNT